MGIKSVNKEGIPAIMYMHPWEFDPDQPKINLGKVQSLRHYFNIKKNLSKLGQLLDEFKWTSFKESIEKNAIEIAH